ncbi:MAG TPA: hypothetical protein PKC29_11020 [Thermodesulfobacteriota bacterium]|nr:hypothetical protein [Thermodesulfobacteriota bacterium]
MAIEDLETEELETEVDETQEDEVLVRYDIATYPSDFTLKVTFPPFLYHSK